MTPKLLVRGARQLLTLQGPRGPRRGTHLNDTGMITDGAVLISNGVITAVGPSRRVENLADARLAKVISAAGRVVMPGLVDCDARPMEYPEAALGFGPVVTEQLMRRLVLLCLAHGTTTLEAKVPLTSSTVTHLRTLRTLQQTTTSVQCSTVFTRPLPTHDSSERVEAELSAVLKKIRGANLAHSIEVECGPRNMNGVDARIVLHAAQRIGFRRKVRVGEDGNSESVSLAAEGTVSCIGGLKHASEQEATFLAQAQVMTTIIPGEHGTVSARMLVEKGVPIAIATGLRSTPPGTLSMQAAIGSAMRKMDLTIDEAITAATVNAAYAAGHGDHSGSIEFGREADLLILDTSDYRDLGQYHGVNLAAMCLKRGEIIFRRQELSWP